MLSPNSGAAGLGGPLRGVLAASLLVAVGGCRREVTLPPADAVRAAQAIDQGQVVTIRDGGELRVFDHYDELRIESRVKCRERENECAPGERFSENCVALPPSCKASVESYGRPVGLTLTDEDLTVWRGKKPIVFERSDLERITLRENTRARGATVAATAAIVALAVTTGSAIYINAREEKDSHGGAQVPGVFIPLVLGIGAGAGSLAVTLPLTAPDDAASASTATR